MLLKRLDYLNTAIVYVNVSTNLCLVNYKKHIQVLLMYTYDYNVHNNIICPYFFNTYSLLFIQVLKFFWIN